MKLLFTLLILSFYLLANPLNSKVYTSVTKVNGSSIEIAQDFPYNGMSGVVVKSLNGNDYILAYVKKVSKNELKIIDTDPLNGGNLANLKTNISVGDRVIGGFLYNKVMILAPNRSSYLNIQNRYGIKSINPDLFMSFLATKGKTNPSSSDYKEFAKLTNIGLFLIFKDGFLYFYDPISNENIAKDMIDISVYNAQKPFYNTFRR